eukprot:scaffold1403_cov381-Prasinococcus_capsulatus_cf.AAC.6
MGTYHALTPDLTGSIRKACSSRQTVPNEVIDLSYSVRPAAGCDQPQFRSVVARRPSLPHPILCPMVDLNGSEQGAHHDPDCRGKGVANDTNRRRRLHVQNASRPSHSGG